MKLDIDQEALREVVKAAILEQLGTEGRERLIAAALEHLLTPPPPDSYTRQRMPSPLEEAFNIAAATVARQIVMEEVAKDPVFIAKVREQVGAAVVKMDEDNYTDYVADALAEALRRSK